jgi:hypothetical protein
MVSSQRKPRGSKPASARKAAGTTRSAKERQPQGLFAKEFRRNLKEAPPGATDGDIFLRTIRSLPPEKVREALATAGPRERAHFFNVIPGDQIRPLIDHMPPVVIGPAVQPPPPPPPSPPGGPPADILTTNYLNVPSAFVEADPTGWNTALTDGQTIHDWSPLGPDWFEWSPVYDRGCDFEREGGLENPVVGVTGWVVPSTNEMGLSNGDIWFTHPWWYDWEYYIAPDPQYEGLLAPDFANTGVDPSKPATDPHHVTDPEYNNATTTARGDLQLPAPLGVLGVEVDQGLFPQSFRDTVQKKTRIATFGRWIVDTGHADFHTEIHPPLLIATANVVPSPRGIAGASEATHVEVMSRPYFPSQVYPEGNFIDHLVAEVAKVETPIFGFPGSWRVEAHPKIYDVPYAGRPFIELFVKPPVPRSRAMYLQQTLMVNFHFTLRSGVAVAAYDAGYDTVGIVIVLGDTTPPALPVKSNYSVSWGQLGSEYAWIANIWGLILEPLDPLGIFILNRGILTDRYTAPVAQSPSADLLNVAGPTPLQDINSSMGWCVGDDQPFPIYGWMDVYWVEQPIVAAPPGTRADDARI